MKISGILRLALVDLGAARRFPAAPQRSRHVALCVSDRVQGSYFSKKPNTIEPVDNLILLARCVLLLEVSASSFRENIHEVGQDQEKISELLRNVRLQVNSCI